MKLLRDPLFHFFIAGLLIFALYAGAQHQSAQRSNTIFVSTADMERMAALYAAESNTLPSPDDMHVMVADHVRTEALTREARRLGLDQGDTVVERRLAQKMTFMIADLAEDTEIGDAALKDWYETHADEFSLPARLTFQNIYFSKPDDPRIVSTLADLESGVAQDWKRLGDPFMLQRQYADLPARETARVFGTDFSAALFALEQSGTWQGPVRSSLGTFLVKITSKEPAELPPFEAVRGAVETSYVDATRRQQNDQAIADLVSKYKVEIEGVTQ